MKNNLISFFDQTNLPDNLKHISQPFKNLADVLEETLPNNPEKTTAFRKLLEARDCAVRAANYKQITSGDMPIDQAIHLGLRDPFC